MTASSNPAATMATTASAAATRPFSFSGTSSTSYLSEAQQQQQQQQQQLHPPHTSRFVEGSMSDRTSGAPPVSFLGAGRSHGGGRDDTYAHRQHHYNTRRSLQTARPPLSAFHTSNTATSTATSASIATTATSDTTTTSSSLRRPRSFLAPLWDGVTRRLHRRMRNTVEADDAKRDQQQQQQPKQQRQDVGAVPGAGLPPSADRPSPDDVLANYQQLMQAGFFSKRAIPATRQGLAGGGGAAAAAGNHTRPDRPPPPPPKTAPAVAQLSPIASPAAAASTTRGTKRGHADVDDTEDGQDGETQNAKSDAVTASGADNTATASPVRSPRKLSKKQRKSNSRLTPGSESQRGAAEQKENGSRPSTARSGSLSSRSTRSHTYAPVQVHQPLPPPPMPTPVTSERVVASQDSGHTLYASYHGRGLAKKRKGHVAQQHPPERREHHYVDHDAAATASERRSPEPRKKRRSQTGPAVVHQDIQEGNQMAFDEDHSQEEQALRPPPTTHYRRLTAPLEPLGSGSSNRRAVLTTISSSSPPQHQPPISFHYPQRVRVRRPIQAQVVEVKASSGRNKRSANEGQRLQSQQDKPVSRSNGKNLLFREEDEDAENQMPVW